jgi:glucokinase
MALALGIEIGGTKLQAGVGDGGERLRSLVRKAIDPARGGEGIRERIPELIDLALAEAKVSKADLAGVGVGFGGPVDGEKVLVSHQIRGWAGFPLRAWLAERTGLPVVLQNDCKAAALAESALGAGKGCRRIFYVTVGSGIGGGLVVDGKVDVGQGLGAGEIGHTWVFDPRTKLPDKLENVASGWGLQRRAQEAGVGGDPPTGQSVYAAAEAGDAAARRVLRETAELLGIGVANVVTLLHPERVIVGGGLSLMGPLFWDPLRASVQRHAFGPFAGRFEVVPAGLGESVVVAGAVLLGLQAG